MHDPPIVSVRSGRHIRLPAHYMDYLPAASHGLRHVSPPPPDSPTSHSPQSSSPLDEPPPLVEYQTKPDHMGLFRVYPTRPSFIPKTERNILAYVDAPTLDNTTDALDSDSQQSEGCSISPPASKSRLPIVDITPDNIFSAFGSPTAGLLMCWQYSGSNLKSAAELNRLWTDFIQDPRFDPTHVNLFNHDREWKFIEKYLHDESNVFKADHGWYCSSVRIKLPHEQTRWPSGEQDPNVPVLDVNGVYHHDLTDVIISALEDDTFMSFHMTPFEQFWKPSDTKAPIKVFGEAYSSSAHLDAECEVNSLSREAGDDLERIVVPLMLWADATQLANFGDASLWPILEMHHYGRFISFLEISLNIPEGSQQPQHVITLHTYPLYDISNWLLGLNANS